MKPRYIAHTGGEMPVSYMTLVEVVFRDGYVGTVHPARSWNWERGDIIAYRVIEQR